MTAMIEEDDRASDEGDRSSGVVIAPTADCGHACPLSQRRRGVCVSCYRKLREADALPLPKVDGRPPTHPLRRWLATLDTGTLVLLAGWIADLQKAPK